MNCASVGRFAVILLLVVGIVILPVGAVVLAIYRPDMQIDITKIVSFVGTNLVAAIAIIAGQDEEKPSVPPQEDPHVGP